MCEQFLRLSTTLLFAFFFTFVIFHKWHISSCTIKCWFHLSETTKTELRWGCAAWKHINMIYCRFKCCKASSVIEKRTSLSLSYIEGNLNRSAPFYLYYFGSRDKFHVYFPQSFRVLNPANQHLLMSMNTYNLWD